MDKTVKLLLLGIILTYIIIIVCAVGVAVGYNAQPVKPVRPAYDLSSIRTIDGVITSIDADYIIIKTTDDNGWTIETEDGYTVGG